MDVEEESFGVTLESSGWRQGGVLTPDQIKQLPEDLKLNDDSYLVVASQSCDIASCRDVDEFVEFVVAKNTEKLDGNFTHNKNPRKLHLRAYEKSDDVSEELSLELHIHNRIFVHKKYLVKMVTSSDIYIDTPTIDSFINWLAARYNRPAFPSEFNRRLDTADKRGKKQRKVAQKANEYLSGIYVQIFPDAEIPEDETYHVNLLCVYVGNHTQEELEQIQNYTASLEKLFKDAGMEVESYTRSEEKVSMSRIKQFKRLTFDDLSYKEETALPVDLTVNLH